MTLYYQTDCPHFQNLQEGLVQAGVEFKAVNLVDQVPSEKELGMLLMGKGWNSREIFNFDSPVYRRMKLDDLIHDLKVAEVMELLQRNGRLIASPLIVADSGCYAPVEKKTDLDYILGLKPLAA